ncbi:barren [Laetiporus sulphureus 93-53]|uniref:Condensin complex subunit 2 n=1 Tax=Laetiporus sulphureus 93-53 TaxID=1314785 RepID=A0A165G7Z9_9APHY|nr:barren [Laetiporus sulphureus 93-53]KZT09955.1 barren [Laetiporus sulphureus 93-53]
MAATRPSRPSRSEHTAVTNDGSDTDPDEDTSVADRRTASKKRISDVFTLDRDESFSSDTGRVPLRSVNINDDMAEKRRRRKSAKVTAMGPEDSQAGPSEVNNEEQGGAGPSGTAAARQKQQLLAVAQAPLINVPIDVMNSNFEEWMKMATDNKINAANSWNFALIDYFHDMSLLRNNTDNSINFQRASCTLDGCVKIWTSRVDSVGTETGKLLSNLANEGRGGDDEEGANVDDPDNQDSSQGPRKRKTHRAESTLAKSVAQLRSKKLDLEFTVDPLFRKTCADFDEGGAQGLLMNHLSLGVGSEGSLRVVFDASDAMGGGEEEEEAASEEPEDQVDISYLRKQFLPDLNVLEEKAISHSIEGFSFSKDSFSLDETTFFREDPTGLDDDDDDAGDFGDGHVQDVAPLDGNGGQDDQPVEDFFVGDQAVGDDYVPDVFGPGDTLDEENQGEEQDGLANAGRPGAFVPFDPRRVPNERDLVMAMTEGDGEGGGLLMDYFEQGFLKNWAGPEHWKLRKVVRRPEATTAAPKQKREKKEAFKIDFLTSSEKNVKTIAKELFVPVTRGAGITLPVPSSSKTSSRKGRGRKSRDKDKDKRNDQMLPDDMHFSSRQLVTLFLKPKFALRMRGHRVTSGNRGDAEIDENFWAQAAADQAAGRADADGDETVDGGAIPFNTQFFHDDYDDGPGFDDADDVADGENGAAVEPGEQDLLAATQDQTRRVRPEFVNHAKRAKRVDVRKLKDNIWKGLDIIVPEPKEQDVEDDAMDTDDQTPTDPQEARQFTAVISGLQKTYPREKMEEISTSFCFICLLHLANERGLKLETDKEDEEIVEEDERKVGRIWDLKVYRDPDATLTA